MSSRRRLNQQQRRRIDHRQQEHWHSDSAPLEEGMVSARFGRHAEVIAGEVIFHCDLRANLRDLVCGDQVRFEALDENRAVIVSRKDRRTALSRPVTGNKLRCVAANLDQLFVVTAPQPEPDLHLLDQYLVAAEHAGIQAVIVRAKQDIADDALDLALSTYQQIGYQILRVSAHDGAGTDQLLDQAANSLCACVGQSGVGKSSLIQQLVPEVSIAVGALSAGVGTHTTTTARAYPLPRGGYLIDAPGIREFPLPPMDRTQIEQAFPELRALSGQCRFRNCLHLAEPDCAVLKALEQGTIEPRRLQSFRDFCAKLAP